MPWFIQLALRQLFPSGKLRPSFFLVVAVLGVTLGVAVLVVVQSVMGGFGVMHREKMVLTSGHINVSAGGAVLHDEAQVMKIIRSHDEVQAAVPYAHGFVMMQYRQRTVFPFLMGIDFTRKEEVIPFSRLLINGSVDNMDDESVLLSTDIANQIGARVGSKVDIYSPTMLDHLKENEVLLPRELTVVGIFETGWSPFDSMTIVSSLSLMQDVYELDGGYHGVLIRLKQDNDDVVERVTDELNGQLPPGVYAETWVQVHRDFMWILQFEKNTMLILLLFIVLVAAFAIAIAQLLTVVRKTREIGLLGAMGARPLHVGAIYCCQGFIIGLIGTVLGCLSAVCILHFRDGIVGFLTAITGSRGTLVEFYQFTQVPVAYSARDFIIITVSTLVISTVAGLVPALRAAWMKPADALRRE